MQRSGIKQDKWDTAWDKLIYSIQWVIPFIPFIPVKTQPHARARTCMYMYIFINILG